MCLPLLTEKIASKMSTTTTWAVYDGDVPIMQALRSILGWRTTAWWRSRSSSGMAWDPGNVQRRKQKVWFHNRGVQWDTPMARWAGEGKDWIELAHVTSEALQGGCQSQPARIHETGGGRRRSPKGRTDSATEMFAFI